MTGKPDALARLQQIARLKSDLEMRRFAAFRAHVEAARSTVHDLEQELEGLFQTGQPFSLAAARLTNALAGDRSRALARAEGELQRLLPGYELARQAAAREFGRAEALGILQADLIARTRRDKLRRDPDG